MARRRNLDEFLLKMDGKWVVGEQRSDLESSEPVSDKDLRRKKKQRDKNPPQWTTGGGPARSFSADLQLSYFYFPIPSGCDGRNLFDSHYQSDFCTKRLCITSCLDAAIFHVNVMRLAQSRTIGTNDNQMLSSLPNLRNLVSVVLSHA